MTTRSYKHWNSNTKVLRPVELPMAWNNVCIYSRRKIAKADLEWGLLTHQIKLQGPLPILAPTHLKHAIPLVSGEKLMKPGLECPPTDPNLPLWYIEQSFHVFLFFLKKRKICIMSGSSWYSSLAEQFISKHAWWFFFPVVKQVNSRTPGFYSSPRMSPTCMSLSLLLTHAFKHFRKKKTPYFINL